MKLAWLIQALKTEVESAIMSYYQHPLWLIQPRFFLH
ncbi:hypothetical protein SAMN00120144_0573 [Hymenobacter roseosalivarius DSM 11622]|uniref:Uncharacterized protein n=1 Tax=Hymenobacter roseosalivarius DSM 11622 TaxID=645990 RepID=A0A1W1VBJ2_9BACT|nr:hypothetical protein SAMN00120144_0573 [Hymenobacter roseosalivarius DSM 11622]